MEKKIFLTIATLLLLVGFVFAGVVTPAVGPTPDGTGTTSLATGQSVAYYLKVLNSSVISQVVSGVAAVNSKTKETLTSTEVQQAQKTGPLVDALLKSTVPSMPPTSFENKGMTVYSANWIDLPDTGNTPQTIDFPKVKCGNENEMSLRVVFSRVSLLWFKVIGVGLSTDGKTYTQVDCSSGWSNISNFGSRDLVFKALNTGSCELKVCGNNVADFTIQSAGSSYGVIIKSPLIPSSCDGKSFSQKFASNRWLDAAKVLLTCQAK